ncbi:MULTISPECIES: YcjF family protein [unclassified Fusibacter]|uniref:YcjF family protein n=1 Tax=unclassified Fusibacter TaxID=2624464 RepID=UPI0010121C81|nr:MULTISPECIES: DUF697 domain-containing protein [unclassified Fusibacter]MCK8059718.1 DUF697 domain-containing protein [Fusibacter sp. A2]NPE21519.1 DUF697 domain-containing protein [Fusibacter sp. A1]RXV61929.1 DUF697 domain-containing protein [Fusibacter sp. A1]
MQNKLIIVIVHKSVSSYAKKLGELIEERDVSVSFMTIKEYMKIIPQTYSDLDEVKCIFLGTTLKGESGMPSITSWTYDRFACRIGFKGNKCVIFARDNELQYNEYKEFKDYCKSMNLDHPDVVVPSENLVLENAEALKNFIGIKNNKSINKAQYSTLLYEFNGKFYDMFLNSEDEAENNEADCHSEEDLKKNLKYLKSLALANITLKQAVLCHGVIHSAAVACYTIGFIPIPLVDTVPMTATQVTMIISLGKIFNNKLTKSDAQVILKTASAALAGRALTKNVLKFIPGIGWTINGTIAGTITEILGWTVANEFAEKNN